MLGAMMYASQLVLSALPNVHLTGVLIVSATVVYRFRALYPIYVYVFVMGLFNGFASWWVPYLYIWLVLWGMAMIVPRKVPKWLGITLYMTVCSLHGFMFGTLYAPFHALLYNLNLEGTLSYIAAGIPFDIIHGVSNLLCGVLIYPIVNILNKCERLTENK